MILESDWFDRGQVTVYTLIWNRKEVMFTITLGERLLNDGLYERKLAAAAQELRDGGGRED